MPSLSFNFAVKLVLWEELSHSLYYAKCLRSGFSSSSTRATLIAFQIRSSLHRDHVNRTDVSYNTDLLKSMHETLGSFFLLFFIFLFFCLLWLTVLEYKCFICTFGVNLSFMYKALTPNTVPETQTITPWDRCTYVTGLQNLQRLAGTFIQNELRFIQLRN